MGFYFYRPPQTLIFTETFEIWSGVLSPELIFPNPNYLSASLSETFEPGSGWSGT